MTPSALSTKPKLSCCKNPACRKPYQQRTMSHTACCMDCALVVVGMAKEKKAKAERKADKDKLIELKPRKWWLQKAKTALHAYIRARDEGKTCISCDKILVKLGRVGGDYDAGHLRSVGSAKHLEFEEDNIHGQCKQCNKYDSGNRDGYEKGIIARYGKDFLDRILTDNTPRHLTIEDFQQIETKYKAKLKELATTKA